MQPSKSVRKPTAKPAFSQPGSKYDGRDPEIFGSLERDCEIEEWDGHKERSTAQNGPHKPRPRARARQRPAARPPTPTGTPAEQTADEPGHSRPAAPPTNRNPVPPATKRDSSLPVPMAAGREGDLVAGGGEPSLEPAHVAIRVEDGPPDPEEYDEHHLEIFSAALGEPDLKPTLAALRQARQEAIDRATLMDDEMDLFAIIWKWNLEDEAEEDPAAARVLTKWWDLLDSDTQQRIDKTAGRYNSLADFQADSGIAPDNILDPHVLLRDLRISRSELLPGPEQLQQLQQAPLEERKQFVERAVPAAEAPLRRALAIPRTKPSTEKESAPRWARLSNEGFSYQQIHERELRLNPAAPLPGAIKQAVHRHNKQSEPERWKVRVWIHARDHGFWSNPDYPHNT